MRNSVKLFVVENIEDGFKKLGALTLSVTDANRIIIGVLQHSPNIVALALGRDDGEEFFLMECEPWRARQIAASLMNKADSIEGIR